MSAKTHPVASENANIYYYKCEKQNNTMLLLNIFMYIEFFQDSFIFQIRNITKHYKCVYCHF